MKRKCRDLYIKAKSNPASLKFSELQKLCECIEMKLDRIKGSHHLYKRAHNPSFLLSIQKMHDGNAKAYQVRQLINFIEENGLDEEE